MKLKLYRLIIVFAFVLSSCSQKGNADSGPQSPELPPTPYPDTPSPAAIDAPLVDAPALVSLDMLNELDGWGVSETNIVRTNDGGVTWYNVTPPDIAETGYSVHLFILNNEHIWMQKPDFDAYLDSGFLYSTQDGGITWTNFKVPFSQADLQFLDADNGWAMADLGAGAGSDAIAIYQTTNGGSTWTQTYINNTNDLNAGDTLPFGGIKSDLVARDMKTAWVSGVTYAPGEIYLFRTDDGGHTWARVSLIAPDGVQDFELGIDRDQMKFVSANDGYLAVRMVGDLTQTAVYITNDSGNTWSLTPAIINGAGAAVFLSAQEAVLYNGERFHITRDAARTWVTVSPDVAFGESFAGMDFVNTMSGWVITVDPTTGHRSLYRTSDGGATWFPVIP